MPLRKDVVKKRRNSHEPDHPRTDRRTGSGILSPYATLSRNTRGREREEPQCDIRPVFQRDRDRILHCNGIPQTAAEDAGVSRPEGRSLPDEADTYPCRCPRIARTIAKALRLNEDLVEAVALGHDLGHTPFRTMQGRRP